MSLALQRNKIVIYTYRKRERLARSAIFILLLSFGVFFSDQHFFIHCTFELHQNFPTQTFYLLEIRPEPDWLIHNTVLVYFSV